ncbi:ribbon-helix-helix domain-containing protein [Synechococcus sp. CS-1324]|uniref:ribbon-helix-helix domain-containing protein n=1 Tax=Synechococcus sp. CS-1324 TaxID=2847980 RepID=UPI00223BB3B2|nr:ribbon-helix-helix domain-containing protein [Synechococcus sp. CS-1324]MCT0230930.1 ribbon-helix-helix domain-containing protein [Synechococcus sp. CS-1324]
MSLYAPPLSVSITHEQLRWLDRRRRHGSISRSAALRQALDALIRADAPNSQQEFAVPSSPAQGN